MLNNISWQGYWTTLALLSAGYYLVIYLLYYRSDFKITFPQKGQQKKSGDAFAAVINTGNLPTQSSRIQEEADDFEKPPIDSEEGIVYHLMDEVTAYFEEARKSRCVNEELLYAVQRILSKYPTLKGSKYQESINNVIVSEAEHLCSIHISSEEIAGVWLGS
ncbi:MAG TPA: hypothetical protein VMR70_13460 [Flavisolibacter sp.]|nr:hypothetical protein [Flavisolibacter sp.]